MTESGKELDQLWLSMLQQVVSRAAHELKDALNGVSLNLEVIRSRSSRSASDRSDLSVFATAAVEQLELLSLRTEALLFLARPPRKSAGGEDSSGGEVGEDAASADVAVTLKHLAALLIPATKADGGSLLVDGYHQNAPTKAPAMATRLALAAGLLALTRDGGSSRCKLEFGSETVVRFSHESAIPCSLDPAIASALAEYSIRSERSGSDLTLVFPGYT